MAPKGPGKKNNNGYDHIPVDQGRYYDYADSSYLQDKDFMTWFMETNLPVGSMWVAWAGWTEFRDREDKHEE